MSGPLDGLVVIDTTWTPPGVIATMLLADYGATVIKLERPALAGATLPEWRKVWDRNKHSVALDVADPAQRDRLLDLLRAADVFVEALGPRRAQELGLTPDAVAAVNPALVHTSISGYGRSGPWSDRPGYEALVAARLGVMAEQDGVRPGPRFLGHPSTLYSTALLAVSGTLAAVHARGQTGHGQCVETSLLDGVLALSTMNWWWNEREVSYLARSGSDLGFGRSRIITDLFQCADGEWLVVHTGGTGGFKTTMDLLGLGDKVREIPGMETTVPLDDEEYHAARVLAPKAFAARPRQEWIEMFHAADLAALPVLRPTEVLDDEQVLFDGVVAELPDAELGTLRQVGRCITYAGSTPDPMRPAPAVGEHTAQAADLVARRLPVATGDGSIAHPLQGLRILDFSSYFAGPYGARLLSDLGADVIKIEATEGDPMRPLPDPFEGAQRGKRTIAVDLKAPDGLRVVHDLVRRADVVMHNFRPGKAERLGIGYEQLRAIRPDLVYCYLPGFGSAGPKSHLKSFAPLLSGFVGNFYEGAGSGQPPVRRVMGNEDYYNGLSGAMAVLMAVVQRDRTGAGQALESAQLRSALFSTAHNFRDGEGRVHMPLAMDGEQLGLGPCYRLYQTADGWVCVAAVGSRARVRLEQALGIGAGLDDDTLAAEIAARLAWRTAADAAALLDDAGVPCEIAADSPLMPELLWDEWLLETHRVLEQHHPTWGWLREIGVMVQLSATPPEVKGCGPLLGQHTVELLTEIGRTPAEIEALLTSGACVAAAPPGEA